MIDGIVLEDLPPTVVPTFQHSFAAMKDNVSVRITLEQIYDLTSAEILDGPPASLDTLNKIAAAINDDPAFAVTVAAALAVKLDLNGGNVAGNGPTLRTALGAASLVDVHRNRLSNGCFQVSVQNGDTEGTTTDYYFADEWRLLKNMATGVAGVKRVATVTPAGSLYRGQPKVNTAQAVIAAAEYTLVGHPIEGSRIADCKFGTADAVPFVCRFFVNKPVAGTYPVVLQNPAADRSYVATFVIGAGQVGVDTQIEVAFPGCTSGTWPTGDVKGAELFLPIAVGSNFHAPAAGAWQNGNYFAVASSPNGMLTLNQVHQFGDYGLRLDPLGTGIYGAFEVPDLLETQRLCARYLPYIEATAVNDPMGVGQAYSTTNALIRVSHVPPARVKPTGITVSGAAHVNVTSSAGGGITSTAISTNLFGRDASIIDITVASGIVAGNATMMRATNAAAKIIFTGSRL